MLTLSPVLHQRRANRHVTEYRPERGASSAWSSAYQDEARELRAFDRIREEPARGRQKQRRPGREVNGNVARPERPPGSGRRKNKRGVAPGQELPSVRTWFAGESRGGNERTAGNNRRAGGSQPFGSRSTGPYVGGGNRGEGGNKRPHAGGRQGRNGNRSQGQGGGRPHGGGRGGGNRSGNR